MDVPKGEIMQVPTARDVAENILLDPAELYEQIIEKSLLENMPLEEALGEIDPLLSGRLPDDALPYSVMSQLDTGIFPPATEAEIAYLQLEGRGRNRSECLRRMLETGSLTLADTKGYRTRTAYRLIRQMARIRGLLEGFDMLQTALNLRPDETGMSLWHTPLPLVETHFLTGNRGIRAVLSGVSETGDEYTYRTPGGFMRFRGATTLPPPVPDRFYSQRNPSVIWKERLSRKVPSGYSPKEDMPLILYCEAMTMLSEQLGIRRGSPREPWAGEYGLAGLLNPYTARIAWPTRDELVLYEEEFLLKVFDKLCLVSVRATENWLQQFFGLSRLEALDIAKTALAIGAVLYSEGAEEMRSLEIKRLDALEDKCDTASDPRAQIAAKRLRLQALGLTRNEEGEGMQAMRDAATAGLREKEVDTEEI